MKFALPIRRVVTTAIFALLFLSSPAQARADDIVIGMSAAFTGPSRGLGIELYRGTMAYLDEVNQKQGGVNGRKIVIKAHDDGYDPIRSIHNTVQLIEEDKVLLLYGYVGTPTTTRILPLLKRYEKDNVNLFFPFTGAEALRQPPYNDFVFNLRSSYRQETTELVDNFVKVGRKRIAVFYQIDAYGRSGWEGVKSALKQHGLPLVEEATYKRGTPFSDSMKAQVEILRQANPDGVISIGVYGPCAAFIRDARDAGWDVPIANISFVGSENLLDLLLDAGRASGKDYTKNLINSQVVPSYHDNLPAVKEYRDLMMLHNPGLPPDVSDDGYKPQPFSFVSLEGFLDAKVLVAVLKKMGKNVERRRVKEAAESLKVFDLGLTNDKDSSMSISFSPSRHQGLNEVYFTVVRKGRFEPIKDWKEWSK